MKTLILVLMSLFFTACATTGAGSNGSATLPTTESRESISPDRLVDATRRADEEARTNEQLLQSNLVRACYLAQAGFDERAGRQCQGARCEELRALIPAEGCGSLTESAPRLPRRETRTAAQDAQPTAQQAAHVPPGSQAWTSGMMPMGNQMPPQQQIFVGRVNPMGLAPVGQIQLGPPDPTQVTQIPLRLRIGPQYVVAVLTNGRAIPMQGGVPLGITDAFGNVIWGAPPGNPANTFGYDGWVENMTGRRVSLTFQCFLRNAVGQYVPMGSYTTEAQGSTTPAGVTHVCGY